MSEILICFKEQTLDWFVWRTQNYKINIFISKRSSEVNKVNEEHMNHHAKDSYISPTFHNEKILAIFSMPKFNEIFQ